MSLKRISAFLIACAVMISTLAVQAPDAVFAAKAKKPAKVKIASVKRSGLKITVKWKKTKNAKKYQVYQKIGSGKWKLKKTLKKLSLTVKGAYGKTYSFKIRGVNGKKKGKYSAVKTLKVPKKSTPAPTPDPEPAYPDPGKDDPKPEEKSEDEKAAEVVTLLIESLPDIDSITLGQASLVEDARAEYLLLSLEAKKFVPQESVDKLDGLEARLEFLKKEQEAKDEADKEAAYRVSKKIVDLYESFMVDDLSYFDQEKVLALRQEYEKLTNDQKRFVDKEATLSLLEEMEDFMERSTEKVKASIPSWEIVHIGNMDFYKIAEEEGKTLLAARDAVVNENGEILKLDFGESAIWRDSKLRSYLNGEFLESNPEIADLACSVEIKSLASVADGTASYITTTDKIFLPTLADVMGGSEYSENDYTYGGAVLPGLGEGKMVMMPEDEPCWSRDPYFVGTTLFVRAYMAAIWQYGDDIETYMTYNNYSVQRKDEFGMRPMLWADSEKLAEYSK